MVVNAVGDIVDPLTGRLVAGAFDRDAGTFLTRPAGQSAHTPPGTNTVIAVVATDVALSKEGVHKVAQMAHDGIARTVYPAHTPWDGDTVFAVSTGRRTDADQVGRAAEMERVGVIGALAAEAVALAILRGIRAAGDAGGFPAARSAVRDGLRRTGRSLERQSNSRFNRLSSSWATSDLCSVGNSST